MKRVLEYFTIPLSDGIAALSGVIREMGATPQIEDSSEEGCRLSAPIDGQTTRVSLRSRMTREHPLGQLAPIPHLTIEVEGGTEEFHRRLHLRLFRSGG